MATNRQAPIGAFPFPVLVNETTTKQAPLPGSALVQESVSVGAQPVVFIAT